jgi:hypothetical protein
MARRNLNQPLSATVSPAHIYDDKILSLVVTRSEAKKMWGKSATSLDLALAKGKLSGRKSFTDGAVLITVASLTALYGLPKDATLFECYTGSIEQSTDSDKPMEIGE